MPPDGGTNGAWAVVAASVAGEALLIEPPLISNVRLAAASSASRLQKAGVDPPAVVAPMAGVSS